MERDALNAAVRAFKPVPLQNGQPQRGAYRTRSPRLLNLKMRFYYVRQLLRRAPGRDHGTDGGGEAHRATPHSQRHMRTDQTPCVGPRSPATIQPRRWKPSTSPCRTNWNVPVRVIAAWPPGRAWGLVSDQGGGASARRQCAGRRGRTTFGHARCQ